MSASLIPDASRTFLAGVWRGEGDGTYPTISPFHYGEELSFTHANPAKVRPHPAQCTVLDADPMPRNTQPVIAYAHKTWRAADKTPMHAEAGYLRPKADGVDLVVAQATGIAEASRGAWNADSRTLQLRSFSVANAEKVLEIERAYTLTAEDTLTYVISMRTHTQPLQEHLRATLRRV